MAIVSPTRPEPYAQGDGSWAQWLNCVLSCATDLMCRASVGYWRVPASKLRTITGDTSGGVSFGQAADATVRATKGEVILHPRYSLSRYDVKVLISAGKALAIGISCLVTRYTTRRTNNFVGQHAVYVQDYAWRVNGACQCEKNQQTQHAEYLVEDPGTTYTGYQWWSADLLYRAAEAHGGGSGAIATLVCQDTEGVWRVARKNGAIRNEAKGDSVRIGNIVQGKSYFVTSTRNGRPWVSDTDGGTRKNWNRVKFGDGKYGFTKGENLR